MTISFFKLLLIQTQYYRNNTNHKLFWQFEPQDMTLKSFVQITIAEFKVREPNLLRGNYIKISQFKTPLLILLMRNQFV